jgi:hypothetical protein
MGTKWDPAKLKNHAGTLGKQYKWDPDKLKNHVGSTGKTWTVNNRKCAPCSEGCACGRHKVSDNPSWFKKGSVQTNPNSLAALHRGAQIMAERRRGTGDYEGQFTWTLKSFVWKRDRKRCRICGRRNETGRGRALVVHHLDYDKSNNTLKNLILLCRGCHLCGHSRGAWPTWLGWVT